MRSRRTTTRRRLQRARWGGHKTSGDGRTARAKPAVAGSGSLVALCCVGVLLCSCLLLFQLVCCPGLRRFVTLNALAAVVSVTILCVLAVFFAQSLGVRVMPRQKLIANAHADHSTADGNTHVAADGSTTTPATRHGEPSRSLSHLYRSCTPAAAGAVSASSPSVCVFDGTSFDFWSDAGAVHARTAARSSRRIWLREAADSTPAARLFEFERASFGPPSQTHDPASTESLFFVQLAAAAGSLVLIPVASPHGIGSVAQVASSADGLPIALSPLMDASDPTDVPAPNPNPDWVAAHLRATPRPFGLPSYAATGNTGTPDETTSKRVETEIGSALQCDATDLSSCVCRAPLCGAGPAAVGSAAVPFSVSSPSSPSPPVVLHMSATLPLTPGGTVPALAPLTRALEFTAAQPALRSRSLASQLAAFQSLALNDKAIEQMSELALWYTAAALPPQHETKGPKLTAAATNTSKPAALSFTPSSSSPRVRLRSDPAQFLPLSLPHCTPAYLRASTAAGVQALLDRNAPWDEVPPQRGSALQPFWMLTPMPLEGVIAAAQAPAGANASAAVAFPAPAVAAAAAASPYPPVSALVQTVLSAAASRSSTLRYPSSWSFAFRFGYRDCYLSPLSSSSALDCLLGRRIFFSGDSLTRYQYLSLVWFIHFGQWPVGFLGSEDGPNITDEHEFPGADRDNQWKNFFVFVKSAFGSAMSSRDGPGNAEPWRLQLLLYKHPVLDIEVALKTTYLPISAVPPWDQYKGDLDVYADKVSWERNRRTRVTRYTEQYRAFSKQQKLKAIRQMQRECDITQAEDGVDNTPIKATTATTAAAAAASSPAPSPLASSAPCDAAWCPDVFLWNYGLHSGNLHPDRLSTDHPVFQSLDMFLAGLPTHYPNMLVVFKTTTPRQSHIHWIPNNNPQNERPPIAWNRENDAIFMRLHQKYAPRTAILDVHGILAQILDNRQSTVGVSPYSMAAPYWDQWHVWPFIYEACNTVLLRTICQTQIVEEPDATKGDSKDDNEHEPQQPVHQEVFARGF